MKNIFIVLTITLCACAFTALAQKPAPSAKPAKPAKSVRPVKAAVDTSIKASPNIAQDAAADISIHTSADTATDTSAHTSKNIPVDTVGTADTVATITSDDDDDLDDDRILAEIALDTTSVIKPDLIIREHNYRRQTRLAIVMMLFIAVALGTSQSWNPK